MNFIKNLIPKDLDPKLARMIKVGLAVILSIIAVVIILIIIFGGKLNYTDIESRMINAAKNYYIDNEDKLPNDNEKVVVSTDTLVEGKYLKSLDKLVKDKNAACSGDVTVTRVNGHLLYSATLNCGDYYATKKLKDVIIANDKKANNGSGLYQDGETYTFKGDIVNNYVSFANKTWRILRINADGTIRMIETTKREVAVWDDRYNSDRQYNSGINDYTISRLRDTVDSIYANEKEFTDIDKAYLVNQNLCIGKRSTKDTVNDGSIECSKTLDNQPLGLLQVNEYVYGSLDNGCTDPTKQECRNYNFLVNLITWTLNADSANTYKVFKLSGSAITTEASYSALFKLVVNVNSQVNYVAGDGSLENPYTFK